MITGAPIIGVTALSGRIVSPGRMHSILQTIAINAPMRIVQGSNVLWFSDPMNILAMWGTASPMNDTGPQNAVEIAVKSPVDNRRSRRM